MITIVIMGVVHKRKMVETFKQNKSGTNSFTQKLKEMLEINENI